MSARAGFAELLRSLRGTESVTAVAERMGVTRQTLLDLENGRSNPTLDRIDRLGPAYGVRFEIAVIAGSLEAAAAVPAAERAG